MKHKMFCSGLGHAGLIGAAVFLAATVWAAETNPSDDTTVYWGGGKRCHVVGCPRLTKDPEELAKMAKMTLAEAKAKGIPLCSRCPGSTTPRRPKADATRAGGTTKGQSREIVADEARPSGETTVYWWPGKKRVHVLGCRRLTKDPAELAKMTKMTLAEAEAKGLPLCSRCPGSTTSGKGNPAE